MRERERGLNKIKIHCDRKIATKHNLNITK